MNQPNPTQDENGDLPATSPPSSWILLPNEDDEWSHPNHPMMSSYNQAYLDTNKDETNHIDGKLSHELLLETTLQNYITSTLNNDKPAITKLLKTTHEITVYFQSQDHTKLYYPMKDSDPNGFNFAKVWAYIMNDILNNNDSDAASFKNILDTLGQICTSWFTISRANTNTPTVPTEIYDNNPMDFDELTNDKSSKSDSDMPSSSSIKDTKTDDSDGYLHEGTWTPPTKNSKEKNPYKGITHAEFSPSDTRYITKINVFTSGLSNPTNHDHLQSIKNVFTALKKSDPKLVLTDVTDRQPKLYITAPNQITTDAIGSPDQLDTYIIDVGENSRKQGVLAIKIISSKSLYHLKTSSPTTLKYLNEKTIYLKKLPSTHFAQLLLDGSMEPIHPLQTDPNSKRIFSNM